MEIGSGMDSEVTDNRELNRRNAASKTKFVVKIFVNGKQVKLIIHVIWVLTILTRILSCSNVSKFPLFVNIFRYANRQHGIYSRLLAPEEETF